MFCTHLESYNLWTVFKTFSDIRWWDWIKWSMWHVKLPRKFNFHLGVNSPKRKGNIQARVLRDLITSPDVVCVFDYQGQSYTKYIPKLLEINIFQTNRGKSKPLISNHCLASHFISIPPGKKRKRENKNPKYDVFFLCEWEDKKNRSTTAKIFWSFLFDKKLLVGHLVLVMMM